MANELARQLRRNRTDAERALWWELRKLKPQGHKFRQQVPIDPYVVILPVSQLVLSSRSMELPNRRKQKSNEISFDNGIWSNRVLWCCASGTTMFARISSA